MNIKKAYSYNDVLLVPKKSNIESRSPKYISTSVNLGKDVILEVPILTANMKHVTGSFMIQTMRELGAMSVMHRFYEEDYDSCTNRYNAYLKAIGLHQDLTPGRLTNQWSKLVAVSFGVTSQERDFFDFFEERLKDQLKVVCIDVAHGHHTNVLSMVNHIRRKLPNSLIIAGNVATYEGTRYLADVGVDVIKCGIGGGSVCSTRVETGNGVPQLTALEEARNALKDGRYYDTKIIADGGITTAGDLVKALTFADVVMLGNLLAGSPEAPGEYISLKDKRYKQYAGSSTHKSKNIEGVIGLVPARPSVKEIVQRLMEGLRSGMSYQGVTNLVDLKKDPIFVEISNAGLTESKPHDIIL